MATESAGFVRRNWDRFVEWGWQFGLGPYLVAFVLAIWAWLRKQDPVFIVFLLILVPAALIVVIPRLKKVYDYVCSNAKRKSMVTLILVGAAFGSAFGYLVWRSQQQAVTALETELCVIRRSIQTEFDAIRGDIRSAVRLPGLIARQEQIDSVRKQLTEHISFITQGIDQANEWDIRVRATTGRVSMQETSGAGPVQRLRDAVEGFGGAQADFGLGFEIPKFNPPKVKSFQGEPTTGEFFLSRENEPYIRAASAYAGAAEQLRERIRNHVHELSESGNRLGDEITAEKSRIAKEQTDGDRKISELGRGSESEAARSLCERSPDKGQQEEV